MSKRSIFALMGTNLTVGEPAPKKPRRKKPDYMLPSHCRTYTQAELKAFAKQRGIDCVTPA